MTTPEPAPPACRNCDAPLPLPVPPYCPQCGQETALRPPTVGEFLQQFGGAYLATEGALWRTLRRLAVPGALTVDYLAGRRRRYVLPLRLYLTVSLVVLLLLRLLGASGGTSTAEGAAVVGPVTVATAASAPAPASASASAPGSVIVAMGTDGLVCTGLPRWLCDRLRERYDVEPRQMAREFERVSDRFRANLGAAMFVLLPGFALGLALVLHNRRLRYTEHLVFALHVHTVWFALLGLSLLGPAPVSTAAAVAAPVYTLLAMRRVYGGRWVPRLARAALLAAAYGALLLAAIAALGLWALLF